jgi:alkaline phosphatase D
MMAQVPTLATWDDHDYTGNNTDGSSSNKSTALRIFEEYWANPGYGTESTAGVFFQWSWGDVDFFMLDDRYWRGLEDSVLGSEQTAWLIDALASSDGVFKILVSGSQWTSDGSSDSWAAFPEARTALFEEIRDGRITGVVLLSGDIHRSELRLMDGASESYSMPELTSSPLANDTSGCGSTDEELLSCYDEEPSWVGVEIDTRAPDPVLLATIHDEFGNPIEQFEITASELDFD